MFKRYAIFFTPQSGRFAQSGAAWLGWDLVQGCSVAQPDSAKVNIAAVTVRPRKYGLHATMKAPFSLADGTTEQDLTDALEAFCAAQYAVALEGLVLSQIGRFLALTPVGDTGDVNALASTVMRSLDPFRAPISQVEFDRKNRSGLSDRQRQLLGQWGYANVEEFFRFHITLTGPVSDSARNKISQVLEHYLVPTIPAPFIIDGLALCGEGDDDRFYQIARFALNKTSNSL
jgi:hypothetical protein